MTPPEKDPSRGRPGRAEGTGDPARAERQHTVVERVVSDLDQTAADADQTASDSDQTAADRDQQQAEADQRTSNRDQAAADREHDAHARRGRPNDVYELSRAERATGTLERAQTSRAREESAAERFDSSSWRDENARLRDLSAAARDRAAMQRDILAAKLEAELEQHSSAQAARAHAAAVRARSAGHRAAAAADRAAAATDRAAAATDRDHARDELRRAQLDQLTGAMGRELGLITLDREINRARHGNGRLVLAFVDVDGLKRVNDRWGHAAGDALLRDVVGAMRSHLRSYDPIVRVGGDEFVCVMTDSQPDEARRRFRDIRTAIAVSHPDASISVGFADLTAEDSLEQLTARGDTALYEAKRGRGTA